MWRRTLTLPSSSGDDKRPRGRGDDPRRGVRVVRDLRLRRPVHHREDPQPDPGDAEAPAHPASGGDVLAAPQDGRLLPHLLPAQRQAAVQGYVPEGIREVLGGPHASHCLSWSGVDSTDSSWGQQQSADRLGGRGRGLSLDELQSGGCEDNAFPV